MDRFLQDKVKGRDINFVAHSMVNDPYPAFSINSSLYQGGLDCRHLITHIRPQEYRPLSLISLSVPHRGSPFMDWCMVTLIHVVA